MHKFWLALFFISLLTVAFPVFAQDSGEVTVETDNEAVVDESFDYLEETQATPKNKKPKFNILQWFKKTFAKKKNPVDSTKVGNKTVSEYAEKDIEELNYLFIQAAITGDTEKMVQLLVYGVNINTVNYQGRTALIEVARLGDAKTAEWLLDRGASINHKDMYDGYALLYATQRGKKDIVNLLIQRGARRDFDR